MESTADILLAHKRKLVEELAQAKAKVEAIEAEIATVDAAMGSIPVTTTTAVSPPAIPANIQNYGRKVSVKAMVLEALASQFGDGATVHELLNFFAATYGRADVARTSLSPQLTTLKNEGKITRDGMTWHLVKGA